MYDGTRVFSSTHTAVVPTRVVKAGIQPKIAQISHDIIKGNSSYLQSKQYIFAPKIALCLLKHNFKIWKPRLIFERISRKFRKIGVA